MYIKSLEIKNFRNYEDFSIEFDKNLNIIIGKNAQGKTNLIEAVFLSSIGKSFRTSKESDLIKFGEENAIVRVSAEKKVIDTRVEIFIRKNFKKAIKKDGNTVRKTSELIDNIIIVIFSPEDLKIVKDEPEKRRKFIDRELSQIKPSYYNCLSAYKKILMQRNAYLKEDRVDDDVLLIWDRQLVDYGSSLMKMRKEFIDKINIFSGKIHDNITNRKENLKITYDSNIKFSVDEKEQREIFKNAMENSLSTDKKMRTTTRAH